MNMQWLKVISIILLCLYAMQVVAGKKDRYEYEDCLLEHLDHAKLDVASRFIAEACEENYGNGPSKTIFSDERKYNECLLDHMVGVESVDAVIRIRRACERKFR
jgi:hypothetical protein